MRKTRGNLSLLFLGTVVIALVFAVVLKQQDLNTASANSSPNASAEELSDGTHFVSIFDDNKNTNVRTDAATVRDALLRADITLNSGDKVEPAIDEPITSNDFHINIYRAIDRVVIDGSQKKHVKTANTNPEDIVADAGIQLLDKDLVELVPYDGLLESGSVHAYRVDRAETVHINYYGKQLDVRTQAKTIADFLREQNIDTDAEKNWISLSLDASIRDGLTFSIQPQGLQTITVDETIAFSETVTQDYDLDYGKRQVVKTGQNGEKTVTYEVNMKDGIELSRQKISEIVTKEPVAQEVRVGARLSLPSGSHEDWMAAAGISPSDYGYVNYIIMHESSWNPASTNGRYWGLYQTTKARLISDCGENWVNEPVCQLRSATGYAVGRYGSWEKAYNFWVAHYWW